MFYCQSRVPYHPHSPSSLAKAAAPERASTELGANFCFHFVPSPPKAALDQCDLNGKPLPPLKLRLQLHQSQPPLRLTKTFSYLPKTPQRCPAFWGRSSPRLLVRCHFSARALRSLYQVANGMHSGANGALFRCW